MIRLHQYLPTTVLFLLLIVFSSSVNAQNILLSSAKFPVADENGDPLNNCIDINGMKQGVWIYLDAFGNSFAKEKYVNNDLEGIDFRSLNGDFLEVNSWETDSKLLAELETEIKQIMLENNIVLGAEQQLAFSFNKKGKVKEIIPIGSWSSDNVKIKMDKLNSAINATKIKSKCYAFILI